MRICQGMKYAFFNECIPEEHGVYKHVRSGRFVHCEVHGYPLNDAAALLTELTVLLRENIGDGVRFDRSPG